MFAIVPMFKGGVVRGCGCGRLGGWEAVGRVHWDGRTDGVAGCAAGVGTWARDREFERLGDGEIGMEGHRDIEMK